MQRKDEILAKKAKLAELKRQRELRQKEFSASRQSFGAAAELARTSPSRADDKEDLDSLISRLVGDDKGPLTPRTPSSAHRSRPSSFASASKTESEASQSSPPTQTSSSATQTLSLAPLRTVYEIRSEPPRREILTYSKGVQTSTPPRSRSQSPSVASDESQPGERPPRRKLSRREKEREEALRENIRKEIEAELKALKDPSTAADDLTSPKQNFPARTLTQEEREAVTSSNDFLDFVERSSKVIERALDEEYDVLADYRAGNLNGLDDDDDEVGGTGRKGRKVREIMQFYDERWSKGRIISDVGFSPKVRNLQPRHGVGNANCLHSSPN